METVYPVHCMDPQLLDLAYSIKSKWDFITEFHITPCELFHGLLLFLLIFVILPNYNGVGCFCSILPGKGINGLLESIGVSLEHRPVLVI